MSLKDKLLRFREGFKLSDTPYEKMGGKPAFIDELDKRPEMTLKQRYAYISGKKTLQEIDVENHKNT